MSAVHSLLVYNRYNVVVGPTLRTRDQQLAPAASAAQATPQTASPQHKFQPRRAQTPAEADSLIPAPAELHPCQQQAKNPQGIALLYR